MYASDCNSHSPKILWGTLCGVLFTLQAVAQSVTVPDVVTLLLADAEEVLTSAGLSPALENVGCSDEYPLTTILSQDPPAGAVVSPGETIFLIMVSSPCSVTVPDIRGMDFDLAEIELFNLGLIRGDLTVECSDTVPAAHIIDQSPPPGTIVEAGTPVAVTVSNGICYRVPDVVGMTLSAAELQITTAGLVTGAVLPTCDDRYPAGIIVGQLPPAGTAVEPGSYVTLQISAACLAVPSVTGLSRTAAIESIRSAGFAAGVVWQECSNAIAAGNVISQSPPAGTDAVPGSQVDLVISSGGCPVSVPAVEGLNQSTAQATLSGANLTAGLIIQQCSNTVPAGNVIFQRPSAGTLIARGSAVDLVVSTGQCERYVTVPSVTGLTESSAATLITAAELYLNRIDRQCSDTVPAGQVINQTPSTGALVVPGASVDLVVSTGGCPVIPDVSGLTQEEAQSQIIAVGLTPAIIAQQCHDTVPAGSVISQSPAPGGSTVSGNTVNLVLSTGPCNAVVPDVTGLQEAEAGTALESAGLVVGQVSVQCSDTVEAGRVISHTPAAGTPVSYGIPVNIVVSGGDCLTAPGVTGQPLGDAQSALQDGGFSIGTVAQSCSDSIAEGTVISQNPPAGASVVAGASFNLVISSGPCPVTVPALEGRSEAVAEAILTVGRLTVGAVTTACSDTVALNAVVGQSPPPGTQVLPGTAVNLVLASGPCTVTMPAVTGQTEADARQMLLAAGMSVSTVTYECDGVPEDEVISQTPAGGVLVTVGTQVTLVVSSGPCPPQTVSVPDLVGQNQISAVSRLISSGLQVGTVTQECSDTIAGGTVIRQDPPAGAELQSGAPVQLTVSSGPCEADSLIVPDVVGQNQLAAAGMLLSAGAQIGAIVLQCSGTAVAGTVISQEPASGTRVGLGTAVDLTVSSGPCGGSGATPETVLVPDVTGLNEYEARQVLQEAGLNASAGLYVFSDAANPGVVLTQSPLSGVEVSYGATVMLQISRGRSPFAPSDGDILNVLYD